MLREIPMWVEGKWGTPNCFVQHRCCYSFGQTGRGVWQTGCWCSCKYLESFCLVHHGPPHVFFRFHWKSKKGTYIYIHIYIYIYEPCCKLSCIVSCIEVTFKQGFEGSSWKTIGDVLKNDTLRHTCRYYRVLYLWTDFESSAKIAILCDSVT